MDAGLAAFLGAIACKRCPGGNVVPINRNAGA